ncbi:MAG: hypothetical protein AW10_04235 [Candidatus Accumulibacter appositus]|uniref:Uncharacterized protein n=1 Tax=Candidatus Accumulibacter appositus TaxID=1454003 RepID=A0A011Q5E4_9PROT|nr:MAG: hypothetical protein AW10_04235 [Candidatus Accumulibacter appositus]
MSIGQHERRGECGQQGAYGALRILGVLPTLDHRGEFVGRQAPECVFLAQAGLQASGDGQKQFIAERVPEAFIDVLELIQVDDQHRRLAALTLCAVETVLQERAQQQTVRQVGQRIVMGQTLDLFLAALELGQIGEHADVMRRLTLLVIDHAQGCPLRIDLAIRPAIPDLALPMAGLRQAGPHRLIKGPIVASGLQEARVFADHVSRRVAGNLAKGRVDGDDLAAQGNHHHPVASAFQGRCIEALAFLELVLGAEIVPAADDFECFPPGVANQAHVVTQPADAAAGVEKAIFVRQFAIVEQARLRAAKNTIAIVGVQVRRPPVRRHAVSGRITHHPRDVLADPHRQKAFVAFAAFAVHA